MSKKEVGPGPCPETSRKRKRGVVARKSSRSAEIAVNSGQEFHRIFSEGLEVTKMLPSIIQLVSAYSLGDDYKKKLEASNIRFKLYYKRLRVEPFWVVSECKDCGKSVVASEKKEKLFEIKLKLARKFCQSCIQPKLKQLTEKVVNGEISMIECMKRRLDLL